MARFKFEGVVFSTLSEWEAALPEMGALEFSYRASGCWAYCGSNLPPDGRGEEYLSFLTEWEARYGKVGLAGVERILNLQTNPANHYRGHWYLLTVEAALRLMEESPTEYSFILERKVRGILVDWEEVFPSRDDGPAMASVVARVFVDVVRPYITEVSYPPSSHYWSVGHWYNGNFGWEVKEVGPLGRFRVGISDPGTIAFQRACALMRWYHNSPWRSVSQLTWIFAAGCEDALRAADDALSGRKGETMANARRKVRAALA